MPPRDLNNKVRKKVVAYERRLIEKALRTHKSFEAAAKALGFKSKSTFQSRVKATGANANAGTEAREQVAAERAQAAEERANRRRSSEAGQRAARKSAADYRRRVREADGSQSGDWEHHVALCATERQLRRSMGRK